MGVRAIRLGENDSVVGMARVREEGLLLTITENGAGRRTPLDSYRLQNRGGKGIINYDVRGKNTRVAAVRVVDDDDDVIMISDDGVIIRIPVGQIAVQSRYGGGVRAMRIAEGSAVVSVATAPREEEDPETSGEGKGPEEQQNNAVPSESKNETAAEGGAGPEQV